MREQSPAAHLCLRPKHRQLAAVRRSFHTRIETLLREGDPLIKRTILPLITICLVLLSGCAGKAEEGFVNLDCGVEAEMTFEDWRSWTKVNPTPLQSAAHPHQGKPSYVDVYVDDLAKDTYLAASAPYPECARIVKPKYTDETATEIVRLAVMVKMPAGYDSFTNDWWYGRYDATGTQALAQGRMWSDCAYCHMNGAPDTDSLFSEEVLAAAAE